MAHDPNANANAHTTSAASTPAMASPATSHKELDESYAAYGRASPDGARIELATPPPGIGAQRRPRFSRSPSLSRSSLALSSSAGPRKGGKIAITSSLLKGPVPKPWMTERRRFGWLPRTLFFATSLIGILGGAAQIYFGLKSVPKLGPLCLVLDEQFDGPALDLNVWTREVGISGWNNGEFEWTTDADANSHVEDGVLYITPSLTADVLGQDAVFDGYNLTVSGCTSGNLTQTECWVYSNATAGTVLPPVQSARLSTRLSKSIKYGRIEVRARMPTGDWLWPAIWMMPRDSVYGPWPRSGEIDIVESRGNGPDYPAQGSDWLSSTLHWGPAPLLDGYWRTVGWWEDKHTTFDEGFHTYVLEWDDTFLWTWIDSRVNRIFNFRFKESKPFFDRGKYPPTVFNGTQEVRLENPWAGSTSPGVAPFDQDFYLIMNVAVGGTNGWFPDGKGGKPWVNGATTAMRDFARAQDAWYPTWPTDPKHRAMAVDYVKMYQLCDSSSASSSSSSS